MRYAYPRIGLFDEVTDFLSGAAESAWDVVTSVIDRIPGSDWLKDAGSSVTGGLRDF